jgi:pilus assembly protein CpaE
VLFAFQKAVARRRRSSATTAKLGTMICTLGPKGGIGKTLTTTNLAAALASRGKRVVIVDLDLQFGDVGLALGLAPRRTLYDLATSSGSLDAEKLEAYLVTHQSGLRALLAPSRPDHASAVTVDLLRQVYPLLRANNDYVIVDTPPGFSPEVISAIDAATDVCMVGTLDSLSLKNTRLGLETLELMGFDRHHVRVILNRADSRVGITHKDVLAIIGRPPDVFVPSHRDVTRSMNDGVPISIANTRTDAARAFQMLAGFYLAEEPPAAGTAAVPRPRRRWLRGRN